MTITPEKAAQINAAIADQGPGYILCTDSDEQLARVARDVAHVFSVEVDDALTIVKQWRDGDWQ